MQSNMISIEIGKKFLSDFLVLLFYLCLGSSRSLADFLYEDYF